MEITIPKKEDLVKTGDSDPLNIYYIPIVKYPFVLRLKKVIQLLGKEKYDKLLEIGTGSGILIPELSRHCDSLFCIDIHNHLGDVKRYAKIKGINAKICYGNVLNLKFKPKSFDAIVCVSVLEHLIEVDKALDNLKRVLKDDGVLILGFPTKNIIGEKIIEWIAPGTKDRHVSSSVKILKEIRKRFRIVKFNNQYHFFVLKNSFYTVCKCIK